MTESQTPTDSRPTKENALFTLWKGFPGAAILLLMAALSIVITIFYNVLFSKAFWQSRELEQNRTKWESLHISNYQIKVYLNEATTAHPGPWTIEVRDGNAVSVIDNNGADVDADDKAFSAYAAEHYFTIPGWFRYVKETSETEAFEVQVEFDPAYGFPASVHVSWLEPCCDGFTIGIAAFKVLP